MHFSKIEGISYSVVKVQVRGDPNLWRVETSLKLVLMCLVLVCVWVGVKPTPTFLFDSWVDP